MSEPSSSIVPATLPSSLVVRVALLPRPLFTLRLRAILLTVHVAAALRLRGLSRLAAV